MFKLLIVLPILVVGSMVLGVGALALLPLLALLPVVFAVGAGAFAICLTVGILFFVVRLLAALFVGIGGLMLAGMGVAALFAGGAVMLVFGVVVAHLLLPLLILGGLIWLIHRAARPTPPAQIAHG